MAVMCRSCCRSREITTPPLRVHKMPCDFCGSTSEDPLGRNYDIPSIQIPNSREDPNARAEREKAGA